MIQSYCLVCGKEIVYTEKAEERHCDICGNGFISNSACSKGHYVCDKCHGGGSVPIIREICLRSESANPRRIAIEIMNSPVVHMHGPEHHIIIGSALAAAFKNAGGSVDLQKTIDVIIERAGKVPGGVCGNWGSCGSAIGAGIFLSVITKATPLTVESWGLCNQQTAECLGVIGAVGGPRCCKRNVGISINTVVDFVSENLGVNMEKDASECTFSDRNKECIAQRCPFYKVFGSVDIIM